MPGMMMGGGMPGMMMGGGMPGMMMGGGGFSGGSFSGSFNGSLGAMGATQAVGLIDIITRIVDPGNWNKPPAGTPLFMMGGAFPGMAGFPGMVGMVGMVGMAGAPGMVGMGPPVDPTMTPPDPATSNSIDFFPPALAIIVRAPSRMHTSITGGIVGGRAKRLEAAASLDIDPKGAVLAKGDPKDPKVKVAGGADLAKKEKLDPTKVWNEAFAKGGVTPGHVVATADFLYESGEFKHAAEFLKANLRHGVVVRPWVYEALAVALHESGADPEEVRRARLSGIALDPNDAQGFLSAARASADRGQHQQALAFCKQAAQLEPNDYHPYEIALAYAESAKDAKSMEWAVGKLVSQDWPVDNITIQAAAKKRLGSLAVTLKADNRDGEAKSLEAALQRLNQRDLIVQLVWDNVGGPAELEMKVKEPSGSICSLEQKQSTGGGILIAYNMMEKDPSSQYVVAHGFSGDYEITVSRVYGQVLNNRARLIITQNAGTDKQTRRIEIIRLDANAPATINLKDGRRTELASVSPAAEVRRETVKGEAQRNVFNDLRTVASANFLGASGPRGGAGTPGAWSPSALAAKDSKNKQQASTTLAQNTVNAPGGAVQMTAQMRLSSDQNRLDMVIRPFFDAVSARENRPPVTLPGIPGGGK
jgi:tetratricopeptide (TPR) repeat protein